MIIWSGLGFLVLAITFAALVGAEVLTESLFADDTYYQSHGWPKLAGFWAAGAAVWWVGAFLRRRQGKVLVEKDTGREIFLRPDHSLFFIRVEHWGPLLFALGVVCLFVTG